MTTLWKDLSHAERNSVQSAFVSRRQVATLTKLAQKRTPTSYRRLYAYATDAKRDQGGVIASALRYDEKIQRDWAAILTLMGAQMMETAAAAASEASAPKGKALSGDWRYTLEQSPQPPFEHVLIIDIKDSCQPPHRLQIETSAFGLIGVDLERPHRGVIQMIFDRDDDVVKAFLDPDRKVMMW